MLLADRIRTKPAAAWLAEPGLEGGVGPVHEPVDLIEDPQLIGRGSLVSLPRSGDKVFANPIRFESADGSTASHGLSDPQNCVDTRCNRCATQASARPRSTPCSRTES